MYAHGNRRTFLCSMLYNQFFKLVVITLDGLEHIDPVGPFGGFNGNDIYNLGKTFLVKYAPIGISCTQHQRLRRLGEGYIKPLVGWVRIHHDIFCHAELDRGRQLALLMRDLFRVVPRYCHDWVATKANVNRRVGRAIVCATSVSGVQMEADAGILG